MTWNQVFISFSTSTCTKMKLMGKTSYPPALDKNIDCTVCSCHVTYAFQSEPTLYSCLNVKELLVWSRREIWSLSDCNWTRTQNKLVCKWTLNHFAKLASLPKWLSVGLRIKWFWVRVQLQPLKYWLQIARFGWHNLCKNAFIWKLFCRYTNKCRFLTLNIFSLVYLGRSENGERRRKKRCCVNF